MNTPDFILCPKLGFFAVGNSRSFWNGKQTVACCQWVILHGQETTITTNFHNYFIKNKQTNKNHQDIDRMWEVCVCSCVPKPIAHSHMITSPLPPFLSLSTVSLSHTHTRMHACAHAHFIVVYSLTHSQLHTPQPTAIATSACALFEPNTFSFQYSMRYNRVPSLQNISVRIVASSFWH